MRKRLCGREQEFGLVVSAKSGRKVPELKRDKIIKALVSIISHEYGAFDSDNDVWLTNGSRIYDDNGLLEVSTAECVPGQLDLIAQEKASELILNRALRRLRSSPQFKDYQVSLNRNNVGYGFLDSGAAGPHFHGVADYEAQFYGRSVNPFTGESSEMPRPTVLRPESVDQDIQKDRDVSKEKKTSILDQEVTYGCHQNYSYRSDKLKKIFRVLRDFIPVSLPFTGNGHILRLEDGHCVYAFSQRARYVVGLDDVSTTTSRGMLQVKNEDGVRGGLGRLHLICRDATRCEFQTWLVDGMTHLALRLAEEGWKMPRKLALADPIETLHELNTRTRLDYRVITQSGPMDIFDYNDIFLKAAKKMRYLSEQEKKIIQEWDRVLKILRSGKWQKLVGELDWATKWFLLKSRMNKHGFKLDSIRAWRINQGYHNISDSPQESWFALLDQRGKIRHLVDPKKVGWAVGNAPATRAQLRGLLIKICRKKQSLATAVSAIRWESATFDHDQQIYFSRIKNPFSVSNKFLRMFNKSLEEIFKKLKKDERWTFRPLA